MSKPIVPTIIDAQGRPSSVERHALRRLQPPAHLDDETKRFLTQLQDNIDDATRASRSDPTLNKVILQAQKATGKAGSPATMTIRHGLGRPFTGYRITRSYAGSDVFAAVDAASNGGKDPTQYLVLSASCTGTYDVEIFAG